jgi:hypothetical protein
MEEDAPRHPPPRRLGHQHCARLKGHIPVRPRFDIDGVPPPLLLPIAPCFRSQIMEVPCDE